MSKIKIRKKILKIRKTNYFKIIPGKNLIINIQLKVKFSKKTIFGGYFPINSEIDCLNILKKLYFKGYRISLPIIKNNNQMEFYKWNVNDPLIINSFGIPQPQNLKKVYPDVLFVPIVAFDKYNNRIGYGGGFYDKYIQKISKIKKCITIGLAFSNQQVSKIETEKFDKKLDLILTEKFIRK